MEWQKTILIDHFDMDTTVELPAGKYVPLMSRKVQAKRLELFGNGKIENGVENRGVFKLSVQTAASAVISGTARLKIADIDGLRPTFIREDRSEDLATGVKVGKGGMTGLERNVVGAGEDSYLIIEFCADATSTAAEANTTTSVPITIQSLVA